MPLGTVSKIMTGETKNPSFVTIEKLSLVLERELQRFRLEKYRSVSVSEFMKMDEDRGTELFRGRIVRDEAPSIRHQRIVRTIGQAIQNYIDSHNGSCEVFNVGVNVRPDMDDDTVFVPDVVTVCDKSIIGEHMIDISVSVHKGGKRRHGYSGYGSNTYR